VGVGFVPGDTWAGVYYSVCTPERWSTLGERWVPPTDLPDRFFLIRFVMGVDQRYPCTLPCKHGWTWHFPSFAAQLALLWSHELFHFAAHQWPQRFPGQRSNDEHQASAFALAHVRSLGFAVQGAAPTAGVP
jgi:hypothetical protein